MEYEVYRHKDATDEAFDGITATFRQILQEDKDLCNAAQQNLNGGVFQAGELHPRVEKGPLFFQETTKKLVMDHWEEEQKLGTQIWPATPQHEVSKRTQEEIDFCGGLEDKGCAGENSALQW